MMVPRSADGRASDPGEVVMAQKTTRGSPEAVAAAIAEKHAAAVEFRPWASPTKRRSGDRPSVWSTAG